MPSLSVVRGFVSLIRLTARQQWRIRELGAATLFLIILITAVVWIITVARSGWGFETQRSGRFRTLYKDYPQQLDRIQMLPLPGMALGIESAVYAPFRAQLADEKFRSDFAFINYSRWVIYTLYLGFLLPLINLAFASQAIGGERESRTLIWLLTRPMPRPLIYLAKWLGMLPWCILVSLLALAVIAMAGGPVGRSAALAYAPAITLGCIAFASVFHLFGSIVRRPAIMGLAYIFFFETLVANLPGSLKLLSVNYYVKSLLYDIANRRVQSLTPESLEIYAPADATTACVTLIVISLVVTAIGAWLFGRAEPKEDF